VRRGPDRILAHARWSSRPIWATDPNNCPCYSRYFRCRTQEPDLRDVPSIVLHSTPFSVSHTLAPTDTWRGGKEKHPVSIAEFAPATAAKGSDGVSRSFVVQSTSTYDVLDAKAQKRYNGHRCRPAGLVTFQAGRLNEESGRACDPVRRMWHSFRSTFVCPPNSRPQSTNSLQQPPIDSCWYIANLPSFALPFLCRLPFPIPPPTRLRATDKDA
jgi:hypothetical protein